MQVIPALEAELKKQKELGASMDHMINMENWIKTSFVDVKAFKETNMTVQFNKLTFQEHIKIYDSNHAELGVRLDDIVKHAKETCEDL